MKRIVILEVPLDGLREALKLPKDAKIVDARRPFGQAGVVEFLIEHPSFPLLPDRAAITRQAHKPGDAY